MTVRTETRVKAEEPKVDCENKSEPAPEETKDQMLRRIFNLYDIAGADNGGPDGKLSRDEFKCAVNGLATNFTALQKHQLERHSEVIFDKLDVNPKDGQLDFAEFKAGYNELDSYVNDPDGWAERLAEQTVQVVKAVDPTGVVAAAQKGGKNLAATFSGAQSKPVDEEHRPLVQQTNTEPLLGPTDDGASCFPVLILATLCLFIVGLLGCLIAQVVYICIGVGSGQSCDVPLKEFALVTLIIYLFNTCCMGSSVGAQTQDGLEARSQNDQQGGQVGKGCLAIIAFTWLIIGAVWFAQAGGFGDAKGNCQKEAPDLYFAVEGYFTVVIAFYIIVAVLAPVMVCLFCMGAIPSALRIAK